MKSKFPRVPLNDLPRHTLSLPTGHVYKNEHSIRQEQMGKAMIDTESEKPPKLSSVKPNKPAQFKINNDKFVIAHDNFGRPLVACKVCGCQTLHLHTRLCDQCWELDSRIRKNFEPAEKIYLYYKDKFESKKKRR